MPRFSCSAFLFDMDGTLVDSSVKVEDIWRIWCERHGVDLASVMAIQQARKIRYAKSRRIWIFPPNARGLTRWKSPTAKALSKWQVHTTLLAKIPQELWTIATRPAWLLH